MRVGKGSLHFKGFTPHITIIICFVQTRIELDHYPEFQDDTAFVTELIAEQGVTCMPGSVSYHYHINVVLM